jgi:hypothetical protein
MTRQKTEFVTEKIGKAEIEYFERVGLKLKTESVSNFLYRLMVEHEKGVGGFHPHIFIK